MSLNELTNSVRNQVLKACVKNCLFYPLRLVQLKEKVFRETSAISKFQKFAEIFKCLPLIKYQKGFTDSSSSLYNEKVSFRVRDYSYKS